MFFSNIFLIITFRMCTFLTPNCVCLWQKWLQVDCYRFKAYIFSVHIGLLYSAWYLRLSLYTNADYNPLKIYFQPINSPSSMITNSLHHKMPLYRNNDIKNNFYFAMQFFICIRCLMNQSTVLLYRNVLVSKEANHIHYICKKLCLWILLQTQFI